MAFKGTYGDGNEHWDNANGRNWTVGCAWRGGGGLHSQLGTTVQPSPAAWAA